MFNIKNINNDQISDLRELNIVVSLDLLYSKIGKISSELEKIKNSINKILDINYEKNQNNISNMLKKSNQIFYKFNDLHKSKIKLIEIRNKYLNLFNYINQEQKKIC